jgi:aldose 1-epimerase
MATDIRPFGLTAAGIPVQAIHLGSGALRATILTRGAVLQDLRLAGTDHSLTLGGNSVAAYEGPMGYFGALVGPVANRIGGAAAQIGGRPYAFAANEGTSLLHGGALGLHARLWTILDAGPDHAHLRLNLPERDGGFPGNRVIDAEFRVSGAALTLTLTATTDTDTILNLANHSYWNLDGSPNAAGHHLTIAADHYLPVTDRTLPTGEVRAVHDAFDLRHGRTLTLNEGYDHNFCLAHAPRAMTDVAWLTGRSGLRLTMATTEPGLQVYDAARLSSAPFNGHGGQPYGPHAGIALEAQRWPDATNHPGFPAIGLGPTETYRQETRWGFGRE